ncbi:hypothetical protein ACEQ8H_001653 [Pleosporales sp. CAS-2024a]
MPQQQQQLPDNLGISAYSRNFYDGTYQMTGNGFTDEAGLYRTFDCYDEKARAPTPLPWMDFCNDDDDDEDKTTRRLDTGMQASSQGTDQQEGRGAASEGGDSPLSDGPADLSDWSNCSRRKRVGVGVGVDAGEEKTGQERKVKDRMEGEEGEAGKRKKGVARVVKKKTRARARARAGVPRVVSRRDDDDDRGR